jgi:hypothetical protein
LIAQLTSKTQEISDLQSKNQHLKTQ